MQKINLNPTLNLCRNNAVCSIYNGIRESKNPYYYWYAVIGTEAILYQLIYVLNKMIFYISTIAARGIFREEAPILI